MKPRHPRQDPDNLVHADAACAQFDEKRICDCLFERDFLFFAKAIRDPHDIPENLFSSCWLEPEGSKRKTRFIPEKISLAFGGRLWVEYRNLALLNAAMKQCFEILLR
jgi:hypothetical protein